MIIGIIEKLFHYRIIKESVMKMDSSIINKEGIEKLLTMLPSEEDISRIEEAQEQTPDLPLGTAEQFLLTLRQKHITYLHLFINFS
jgi:hypothetical protein